MNYLDVILALPLLWGVYRGFKKGLIISVASLVALVLGIYIAVHFASFFSGYIHAWFNPAPQYLKVITFAIVFLIIVILVRLLGWGLDRMIKSASLGFVNRILGALFNVLKWAFIVSAIISLFEGGSPTRNFIKEQTKEDSILYKPLSAVAPFVFPYLKFEKLKENIQGSSAESANGKEP